MIWLRSIGKSNQIAVENLFNRQCIRITALEFGHRSINLVSVHPIRPFNPVRFSPNNLCRVCARFFFHVFIMACRNCNKPWIRCLDYLNIDTNIARVKLDGNRVFRYNIKFKWCAYTTMLYKYNLLEPWSIFIWFTNYNANIGIIIIWISANRLIGERPKEIKGKICNRFRSLTT